MVELFCQVCGTSRFDPPGQMAVACSVCGGRVWVSVAPVFGTPMAFGTPDRDFAAACERLRQDLIVGNPVEPEQARTFRRVFDWEVRKTLAAERSRRRRSKARLRVIEGGGKDG